MSESGVAPQPDGEESNGRTEYLPTTETEWVIGILVVFVLFIVLLGVAVHSLGTPTATIQNEHGVDLVQDVSPGYVSGSEPGVVIDLTKKPTEAGVTDVYLYYRGEQVDAESLGPYQRTVTMGVIRLDPVDIFGQDRIQYTLVFIGEGNEVVYEATLTYTDGGKNAEFN